ncbi:hydrogenase maturation nickel metallochaperone HypA [Pseudonocardia sp. GCM10023141]|uniref:hydrogenase maturation nickel metallochaperone HypA n=1 Tax=Pseudonocardia sp. GCM10023141 TaxID=3252653 RepID=UPI0036116451
MHELSICRSIADIVTKHADGRHVATVHIRIGQLRQIVPDTLLYCWSMMNSDTPLAGTELQVESIPGALRCATCHTTQTLDAPVLICNSCSGRDVEIISGEEFLITTLDLAEA